jgi:hypothetical protein
MFRDEMPLTLGFVLGALQAGVNARADHRALELGECASDLEHELACRRRGVDCLLIEVQVHAAGLQALDGAQKIDERTAKPIDRPGHHNVEFSPARVLQHGIEARPAVCSAACPH